MFIEFKDSPPWAQTLLKSAGFTSRAVVEVQAAVTHQVGGTWHDANRVTLHFVDGRERKLETRVGTYGGANIFASAEENAVNLGGEITLPNPDCMVLELHTYPKMARLYVHPEVIPLWLPKTDGLSRDEQIVLVAVRSYKSSYLGIKDYRCWEARQATDISKEAYQVAKARLIEQGHLDKRGALTVKGRNAVGRRTFNELVD